MPISLTCPHCGKKLKAAETALGTYKGCPHCQQMVMILPDAESGGPASSPTLSTPPSPRRPVVKPSVSRSKEPSVSINIPRRDEPVSIRPKGVEADIPERECPRCGEMIPETARVCRFCGANFQRPALPTRYVPPRPQRPPRRSADLDQLEWAGLIFCPPLLALGGMVLMASDDRKGSKLVLYSLATTGIYLTLCFIGYCSLSILFGVADANRRFQEDNRRHNFRIFGGPIKNERKPWIYLNPNEKFV